MGTSNGDVESFARIFTVLPENVNSGESIVNDGRETVICFISCSNDGEDDDEYRSSLCEFDPSCEFGETSDIELELDSDIV